MSRKEFARITSRVALKRSTSAPSIVVIGPSTSGKSTLVYVLVNPKIVRFIKKGIGDKNQTTIIPCNFAFDERINKDEHFSIQVRTKDFSAKEVHIEILEQITKLFIGNELSTEDTLESMDLDWFEEILEPKSAAYHLSRMKADIQIQDLQEAVADILYSIEDAQPSFSERVRIKKTELSKQKIKLSEIKKMVFEEMWGEVPRELLVRYFDWLNSIGEKIFKRLKGLMGSEYSVDVLCDYSVDEADIFSYGGNVLQTLFDPFEPFSLIVEDMTLACRPRMEVISKSHRDIPLRFVLRDTMGLTQIGMDSHSIKDALDIALNCTPDSILLLLSLEERNDVITESCNAIAEKISKADKLNVPVNILFTKADRLIGNIINKSDEIGKDTVLIKQSDYDSRILEAIQRVEQDIEGYLMKFTQKNGTWLSLRYLEEDIDPIQKALKELKSDKLERFTPDGLHRNIEQIIRETQQRILPVGIENPLFVTAIDENLPALKIGIEKSAFTLFEPIRHVLTEDKAVVNGYTITNPQILSSRSVIVYYNKLQIGLGHTTRAYVYGNFSINMKALLKKILREEIIDFSRLYGSQSVSTVTSNLSPVDIKRLVQEFDKDHYHKGIAFNDINPTLVDQWSEEQQDTQILHQAIREYFNSLEKYNVIMDRVAFNLSYGNEQVRKVIDDIYRKPISYDKTMREMQDAFKELFVSPVFLEIIAEEIGKAMTELVNKMVIVI